MFLLRTINWILFTSLYSPKTKIIYKNYKILIDSQNIPPSPFLKLTSLKHLCVDLFRGGGNRELKWAGHGRQMHLHLCSLFPAPPVRWHNRNSPWSWQCCSTAGERYALLINNWYHQTRAVDDPMKGMSRLLRTSKAEVKVPLWQCDSGEGLRLKSALDLSFRTREMRKALDPAS